jgi:hypothetical protein
MMVELSHCASFFRRSARRRTWDMVIGGFLNAAIPKEWALVDCPAERADGAPTGVTVNGSLRVTICGRAVVRLPLETLRQS